MSLSSNFRFAHLADCHIGGWSEDKLKNLSIRGFKEAVEIIIREKLDFLIIAGDLFNTSIPSIDAIKQVALSMRYLKEHDIPIFIVPGSHDYSPSGKTMLDVLENAGLCTNVYKYNEETKRLETTEHILKSGETITFAGICGLAGGLERLKYEELSNKDELENLEGFKIFLFHTLLTELKPQSKDWEKVPSETMSLLPKNFNYYPGGHPHFIYQKSTQDHPLVAYPGPLFPNNFKELEELKHGGFYIINVEQGNIKLNYIPIEMKKTVSIVIDADEKTAEQLESEIKLSLANTEDCIVTVRISGTLKSGKPSEINFKKIFSGSNSYILLKNTSKLKTKEFSEMELKSGTIEEVEDSIIKEGVNQIEIPDLQLNENQELLTNQLMTMLNKEKLDGEKNIDFESRILKDMIEIFTLGEIFNDN
ncbi:MAG: DNA repair exonuclease [Nanoarchaeota archaeon]|nr:DNA repair exonuclease [Nanoarchaeota archaeon]